MRIDFTKMHGAGNDVIVFDAPAGAPLPSAEVFRRLGNRRTGIGFDQAMVVEKPRRAGTVAYYRIFNSDGSEVEQCGNGVRCLASLLYRRGLVRAGEFVLDCPAGLIRARVDSQGQVSIDMGVPNFDPRSLPFDAPAEADRYTIDVDGTEVTIAAVSMGNPHAVLTVPSVDNAPVERLGPLLEQHRRFPNRVNVGFMEIIDRGNIKLRVYERGAGETLACGTGTCAAVAVGRRAGLLESEVRVQARGGELRVNWPGTGEHIWLTGPAEVAFEGRVEI